jgi:enoyl-CoA hydratase/carnithine racemase
MDQPLPSHDDLDDFVDTLARRIASFDKPALAEAKRLVNRRTLPRAEDLVETQATFLTAFSWPTLRERGARLRRRAVMTSRRVVEKCSSV